MEATIFNVVKNKTCLHVPIAIQNVTVNSNFKENVTTCNIPNYTHVEVYYSGDLSKENDDFARNLIPAMLYVGILMVVGCVGNSLVVYVYGFRFKTATQHSLIVCLACFDLLMSCIAMPSEITDMRFHHLFSSAFACKLLRFITMFSSISSSFVLVIISVDRHRRVTKPLTRQISVRRARIWEVVSICMSCILSWPTLVISGLRTSETRIPGLNGTDCSVSNEYEGTKFPLAHNAVLGAGFLVVTIVLFILYFRIWKTAKRHTSKIVKNPKPSVSGQSMREFRSSGEAPAIDSPKASFGSGTGLSISATQKSQRDSLRIVPLCSSCPCNRLNISCPSDEINNSCPSVEANTNCPSVEANSCIYKEVNIDCPSAEVNIHSPCNEANTSCLSVEANSCTYNEVSTSCPSGEVIINSKISERTEQSPEFSQKIVINCSSQEKPTHESKTESLKSELENTRWAKCRHRDCGNEAEFQLEALPSARTTTLGHNVIFFRRAKSLEEIPSVDSSSKCLPKAVLHPAKSSPDMASANLTYSSLSSKSQFLQTTLPNPQFSASLCCKSQLPTMEDLWSNSYFLLEKSMLARTLSSSYTGAEQEICNNDRDSSIVRDGKLSIKMDNDTNNGFLDQICDAESKAETPAAISCGTRVSDDGHCCRCRPIDGHVTDSTNQRSGFLVQTSPVQEGVKKTKPSLLNFPDDDACLEGTDSTSSRSTVVDDVGADEHNTLQTECENVKRTNFTSIPKPLSMPILPEKDAERTMTRQEPRCSCNILQINKNNQQNKGDKYKCILSQKTVQDYPFCKSCTRNKLALTNTTSMDDLNLRASTQQVCSSHSTDHFPFLDLVTASDFSHLIGETSQPMAVPDASTGQRFSAETANAKNNLKCSQKKMKTLNRTSPGHPVNLSPTSIQSINPVGKITSSENKCPLSPRPSVYSLTNQSGCLNLLPPERYRLRSTSVDTTTTSLKVLGRRVSRHIDKTTIVAFSISFVFIVSFLPYLALMFVRAFVKNFDYGLQGASLCVYNIFLRFYLLNSAINPILYGLFNARFRQECKRLLFCFIQRSKKP